MKISSTLKRRSKPAFVLGLVLAGGLVGAHEHGEKTAPQAPVFQAGKLALVGQGYTKDVEPILRGKCWDCHGNETHYPWYHMIPGIKGMIDEDVSEAREHLNFTGGYPFTGHDDPAGQLKGLESVANRGWMPPRLYKLMHPSSKLDDAEKATILAWVSQARKTLGIDYFCPMHPEVVSETPGKCPQCQMKLEQRIAGDSGRAAASQKEASGEKTASYVCPMHPKATSDKPGSCPVCGMPLEKKAKP